MQTCNCHWHSRSRHGHEGCHDALAGGAPGGPLQCEQSWERKHWFSGSSRIVECLLCGQARIGRTQSQNNKHRKVLTHSADLLLAAAVPAASLYPVSSSAVKVWYCRLALGADVGVLAQCRTVAQRATGRGPEPCRCNRPDLCGCKRVIGKKHNVKSMHTHP